MPLPRRVDSSHHHHHLPEKAPVAAVVASVLSPGATDHHRTHLLAQQHRECVGVCAQHAAAADDEIGALMRSKNATPLKTCDMLVRPHIYDLDSIFRHEDKDEDGGSTAGCRARRWQG